MTTIYNGLGSLFTHLSVWPLATIADASQDMAETSSGLLIAGCVIAALILIALAYVIGNRRALMVNDALIQAGRWVLNRAREATGERLSTKGDYSSLIQSLEKWWARSMKETRVTTGAINEEMQADLELARDFQMAYLERPYPKIPETHIEGRLRLVFHHRYQPASALGGDFFDLIPLAPDTAGVFVADVMGHGARSALITAMLRTLLRDLKAQGRNARHYVGEVNKQLCEIMRAFPQPLFVSAFYFVPDTTSRVATYTTAGHPAPFHLRRSIGRLSRLDVPAPHGAALGIIAAEEYTGGHVRLLENDAFIFFTDGVYEASNHEGEEFGLARIEKVIRTYMYKDVKTIIDEVMKALLDFTGETALSDDICMVGVDVTTAAEPRSNA